MGVHGLGARLELVGVRSLGKDRRIPRGAHLLEGEHVAAALSRAARQRVPVLGHMTSITYSPNLAAHIGLALVSEGRSRIGARLHAVSPLAGVAVEVELVAGGEQWDGPSEREQIDAEIARELSASGATLAEMDDDAARTLARTMSVDEARLSELATAASLSQSTEASSAALPIAGIPMSRIGKWRTSVIP